MAKLVNRAGMTTATTGTGTITLGSAVAKHQTFAAAGVADVDIVSYVIEDGDAWEIGRGTYTAEGTTLARTTILESTNSDSAIDLSGTAEVYVTLLAEDITPMYSAYICIQDQKSQNTAGGTFTAGDWRTRDLNTEVADTGNHASVASNQITLAAGTYRCLISCPAYAVSQNQARLYNITDAGVIAAGSSEFSFATYNGYARSIIATRFTLAAQKVLEVQHRSAATTSSNGLGVQTNVGTEVYTIAEFWKEA